MKKIRLSALSLCTFFLSTQAYAADAINMTGTWVGVANVAVLGVNPHHNTKDPKELRFVKTEFTFIIDKQQLWLFKSSYKSMLLSWLKQVCDCLSVNSSKPRADFKPWEMVDHPYLNNV